MAFAGSAVLRKAILKYFLSMLFQLSCRQCNTRNFLKEMLVVFCMFKCTYTCSGTAMPTHRFPTVLYYSSVTQFVSYAAATV